MDFINKFVSPVFFWSGISGQNIANYILRSTCWFAALCRRAQECCVRQQRREDGNLCMSELRCVVCNLTGVIPIPVFSQFKLCMNATGQYPHISVNSWWVKDYRVPLGCNRNGSCTFPQILVSFFPWSLRLDGSKGRKKRIKRNAL